MATKQDEKAEQKFFAAKAKEPADDTPKPAAKPTAKPDVKPDVKPAAKKADTAEVVQGHITVKGSESSDRRLFQTSPEVKEWLTQAEAKAKGFYWAEDEDIQRRGGPQAST